MSESTVLTREEILLYYETFIFRNGEREGNSEDQQIAFKRLVDGNRYFYDNRDTLTFYKICTMITKTQNLLIKILPPRSHSDYERDFSRMNELIGWCNDEIKRQDASKL